MRRLITIVSLIMMWTVVAEAQVRRDPTSSWPGRVSCSSHDAKFKGSYRGGVYVDRSYRNNGKRRYSSSIDEVFRNVCFERKDICLDWMYTMIDRFPDGPVSYKCRTIEEARQEGGPLKAFKKLFQRAQ